MSMTSMSGSNNVVVIGVGAAGMMAAGTAASFGAHVTLLEPNGKLGKKLFITGKGRCNVTNNCTSDEVLKNVPVNPRFLYSALSGFSPADAMAFFEAHGCKLKTERGNRVFPESDQAGSVMQFSPITPGYGLFELLPCNIFAKTAIRYIQGLPEARLLKSVVVPFWKGRA